MAYIIYGTGIFSDVLLDEILMDDEQVLAFCLDDNLIDADTHLDRPLLSFSNVEEFYPPTDVDLLIGITYQKKNETRNAYYQKGIDKGYSMSGFVSKNSNISKKTNEDTYVKNLDTPIKKIVKVVDFDQEKKSKENNLDKKIKIKTF